MNSQSKFVEIQRKFVEVYGTPKEYTGRMIPFLLEDLWTLQNLPLSQKRLFIKFFIEEQFKADGFPLSFQEENIMMIYDIIMNHPDIKMYFGHDDIHHEVPMAPKKKPKPFDLSKVKPIPFTGPAVPTKDIPNPFGD